MHLIFTSKFSKSIFFLYIWNYAYSIEKNHEYRLTFAAKLYTHIRACTAPAAAPIHALNNARASAAAKQSENLRESSRTVKPLSPKKTSACAPVTRAKKRKRERERKDEGRTFSARESITHSSNFPSYLSLSLSSRTENAKLQDVHTPFQVLPSLATLQELPWRRRQRQQIQFLSVLVSLSFFFIPAVQRAGFYSFYTTRAFIAARACERSGAQRLTSLKGLGPFTKEKCGCVCVSMDIYAFVRLRKKRELKRDERAVVPFFSSSLWGCRCEW